MYKFDAKKVKDELVQWMKDYFKDIPDTKLVVGISGGKDSTIVAALGCEALGKDRVVGVFMPNGTQYDIQDAYDVAEYLGIQTYEINIQGAVEHILSEMRAGKNSIKITEQTKINLPPRVRTHSLLAIAQSINGRISCNCNLSEDWIGYSTYGGDDFGSFGPLRGLTVTELKQIGKELGLPDKFINKIPQDGLCGKTDEENFGFTYEVLDKYIRTGEIDDLKIKNKIDTMHKKNLFKLKPMPSYHPNKNLLNTNIIRKETYSIEYIKQITKDVLMNKDKKQSIIKLDGDELYGNSDRYKCFFTKGVKCSCCGIEGKFFAKEKEEKQNRYHLNLYGIDDNGDEVLMTKDHITPRSKGGKNHIDNYQTMCVRCNRKKGNS